MRIGIIGVGFVGLSFATVLGSKGYDVFAADSDQRKVKKINSGIAPFYEPRLSSLLHRALKKSLTVSTNTKQVIDECDLIFITVGTPTSKNGSINLTTLISVTNEIGKILTKTKNKPIIIIKSTVIPGTSITIKKILEKKSKKIVGKDFGLITNPEFLREGKAIHDTLNPHIVVLGGEEKNTINKVKKFYQGLYRQKIPYFITNPETAEIIKYANNAFLATKISFINQIANICQSIPRSNVDEVAKAIGLDPRIGSLFLNAGPGYGGSCLPKDLQAFISFSSKIGQNSTLLTAVQKTNSEQVKQILNLMKNIFPTLKGKRITILGLSFKEDSDDVRESVSIRLIKLLLRHGAKIIVHDPLAIENTKQIFDNKIFYSKKISDSLRNSECAVIMTPWNQYSKLTNKNFQKMKKKIIVDTRRLLADKRLDVSYYAIGIGN